jgi:hypothetical protein
MLSKSKRKSVVQIYKSETEAEAAITDFQRSGFDMQQLSIVALSAGLYILGIPKDMIERDESVLTRGRFVVIAHGGAAEAARARNLIRETRPEWTTEYPGAGVSKEAQPAMAY